MYRDVFFVADPRTWASLHIFDRKHALRLDNGGVQGAPTAGPVSRRANTGPGRTSKAPQIEREAFQTAQTGF